MTPPMQNYTSNGTRRVEFSGLSTIDSGAPEETPTNAWDSETDHLLSYFLSDPGGTSTPGNAQYQEYSSTHSHSKDLNNPPLGMNASYGPGSSRTSSNSTLTEVAEPPQPRTPAMQFYHPSQSHSSHSHSQPQSQPPTSYARQTAENIASMQTQSQLISSSSSSSLSSMAAALVSGGPVLHHQIHHRHHAHPQAHTHTAGSKSDAAADNMNTTTTTTRPSSDSPPGHGDDSPISPAALIGTGHENLMLPPPSRRHGASGSNTSSRNPQQPPQPQQQRSYPNAQPPMMYPPGTQPPDNSHSDGHLEWLKQLNARAKAANHNSMTQQQQQPPTSGAMMAPPPQPGAPMVTMPPMAPGVFHAGTFPSAAAAAAAVAQNPMLYQAALNHKFHMAAQSQGESEEKRARRLERNRESARKSRRRKKERLATLEAQVDRLHTQIEEERRNQVNAMCATLKQVRKDEIDKLLNDIKENPDQINTPAGKDRLINILRSSSGGSLIAQSTTEFQYNSLRQILLPRYQKFLLWLTLHNESFFAAGKEEYTRKDGKQVLRVSSGRVSSKQIGDELTNGWKTEKPDGKKKSKADTPDIGERSNPTSRSLDAPRMWPLLCFELSISVDQEERILQALKRLQQMENLANYRSQLAAATKLTCNLTEAISSQCRASTVREDRSFFEILTPAQSAKFHEWAAANHERCTRVIRERRPAPEKVYPVFKETSLEEFCKRLEEVLRISKKDQETMDEDTSA